MNGMGILFVGRERREMDEKVSVLKILV